MRGMEGWEDGKMSAGWRDEGIERWEDMRREEWKKRRIYS